MWIYRPGLFRSRSCSAIQFLFLCLVGSPSTSLYFFSLAGRRSLIRSRGPESQEFPPPTALATSRPAARDGAGLLGTLRFHIHTLSRRNYLKLCYQFLNRMGFRRKFSVVEWHGPPRPNASRLPGPRGRTPMRTQPRLESTGNLSQLFLGGKNSFGRSCLSK